MTPPDFRWLAGLLIVAAAGLLPAGAQPADSASSIAAGGLVPVRSSGLVLAKQVVRISDRKVMVEYDVRNDGPGDAMTELDFHVPAYNNGWDAMDPATQAFRSLRIWVDGKPQEYLSRAKAELDGRDVTKDLEKAHIDVASFGHLVLGRDQHSARMTVISEDFERLPEKEKHRLVGDGLFKGSLGYCLYTVRLTHYWQQSFPAHATVQIRLEYTPVVGFTEIAPQADTLKAALTSNPSQVAARPAAAQPPGENRLGGFCADSIFAQKMMFAYKLFAQAWGMSILPHWVDYDLLSDRGWNQPIRDFTLVVETPQVENQVRTVSSFCSPGVTDKQEGDEVRVHLTNFVPAAGLHIGFFNSPFDEPPPSPIAAK